MTDNEIIKAFECCNNGWCDGRCPYYGREDIADCREQSGADQLDLINRQKAEIKRLQNKVEELSEVLSDTIRIRYAECRAEAIKEYTELLKTKFDQYGAEHYYYSLVDDVAKEMGVDRDD